jgi:hypothetical protein
MYVIANPITSVFAAGAASIHAALRASVLALRQHFLNFLPLPHGHGSLRPTALSILTAGTPGAQGSHGRVAGGFHDGVAGSGLGSSGSNSP